MIDFGSVLTAGALTILLVQGLKWVVRKVKKDPIFDFSSLFYWIANPIGNALVPFVLVWLGLSTLNPLTGFTVLAIAKYLITIVLGSLVTFFGYNTAVKPLSDYETMRKGKATLESNTPQVVVVTQEKPTV